VSKRDLHHLSQTRKKEGVWGRKRGGGIDNFSFYDGTVGYRLVGGERENGGGKKENLSKRPIGIAFLFHHQKKKMVRGGRREQYVMVEGGMGQCSRSWKREKVIRKGKKNRRDQEIPIIEIGH